ncbi:MAG: alpha-xylosidase, partial [Ruminiclostridium sp.]|nr:alpha-xylosidase [Ruminiclostridium sp.]
MKFSDGFWLNKPGYDVNYATQMYEIHSDERSITVVATSNFIQNRGMTLGGPILEITFTSTLENSIKVTVEHYRAAKKTGPDFTLYEDSSFKPVVEKLDYGYRLTSGKTSVELGGQGGPWDVRYYYDGKLLTKSGWRTTSYIKESDWRTNNRMLEKQGQNFYADSSSACPAIMREMLNISVGENIYGFGEKFSTFVKNGQTVDVWNN